MNYASRTWDADDAEAEFDTSLLIRLKFLKLAVERVRAASLAPSSLFSSSLLFWVAQCVR